jgi:hypothetical protein
MREQALQVLGLHMVLMMLRNVNIWSMKNKGLVRLLLLFLYRDASFMSCLGKLKDIRGHDMFVRVFLLFPCSGKVALLMRSAVLYDGDSSCVCSG